MIKLAVTKLLDLNLHTDSLFGNFTGLLIRQTRPVQC